VAARIYIVGGPGSGKTTLAEALGRRLSLSVLRMDEHLDWRGLSGGVRLERDSAGHPSEAMLAARQTLIDEHLARAGWIVEGAEPGFIETVAALSDLIVWCDPPFATAALRIVRRHIRADFAATNAYPGYRRLYRFLRSARQRYGDASQDVGEQWTRTAVASAVGRHGGKVIRITGGSRASNLEAVLQRLSAQLEGR
jgi:adenylate kinase family enzyme